MTGGKVIDRMQFHGPLMSQLSRITLSVNGVESVSGDVAIVPSVADHRLVGGGVHEAGDLGSALHLQPAPATLCGYELLPAANFASCCQLHKEFSSTYPTYCCSLHHIYNHHSFKASDLLCGCSPNC